jgi:hypothetical protein
MKNSSDLLVGCDFEINKILFTDILPFLGDPEETDPADKCPIWYL